MAEATYSGRCFCGAIEYRVTGPVKYACFCHCESCRRASGAPYVAWGTFEREKFSLVKGKLAEHESSPRVTRGACAVCGTSLTYSHERRAADIDVTLVTLDEPNDLVPQSHIWVEDKLPYVVLADGLPQFKTLPGR